MHNNFHFLKKLSEELNHKLIGFKIGSCFSQEKDELIIGLENIEEEFFIKCVATPSFSCLYFPIEYARARKNSVNLWPEIINKEIIKIGVFENERAIFITLEDNFTIVFKFFGNRPNVLLYQNGNQIALFNNSLLTDKILLLPGFNRTLPITKDAFIGNNGEFKKVFLTWGKIVNSFFESELSKGLLTIEKKWELAIKLQENLNSSEYFLGYFQNIPVLSLITLTENLRTYTNAIQASNDFYVFYQKEFSFKNEKQNQIKILEKQKKKAENYVLETKIKLEKLLNERSNEEVAHVLMANLHQITEGLENIELFDFYTNKNIIIKLKKDLSVQKNAENYYRKSKNEKIEIDTINQNIINQEINIQNLEEKLLEIAKIESLKLLKQYLKVNQPKIIGTEKKELFKCFYFEGYEILVGKNSKNNDILTTQYAQKEDYWFHARDCAGSHVVLKKLNNATVPNHVIEYAAGLAAFYSKRKNEKVVPVIFTQKKYVRKTKTMKEGQVSIEKESTIMVEPVVV